MQIRRGNAPCGDVDLHYEDLGDPEAPPVLLIMGIGAQLPMWPDGFCALLVDRGYRVIRYDHRDIGLSTKFDGQRPDGALAARLARYTVGRQSPVPYTLVDMADDARGLLDHLGIARAHVVGASMGGMIAQILAGAHTDRVASLGLVMTGPSTSLNAIPAWRVIRRVLNPPGPGASLADRVAYEARNIEVFNGPNFLPEREALRERVAALNARSDYPEGSQRQFDAILGTGSLLKFAKKITAPTVVIHGSVDPLVRIRNGRRLARVIPGARFVVVDGMGHDLPEAVWRGVVDALVENATSRSGPA